VYLVKLEVGFVSALVLLNGSYAFEGKMKPAIQADVGFPDALNILELLGDVHVSLHELGVKRRRNAHDNNSNARLR
jgi:hypothetical protein